MKLDTILANNKKWVQVKLDADPEYFLKLSHSQKPTILYIGCSDSRVAAEEMMGVSPGEVFVHRNIGNMVPNSDLNVMSVIHYAVDHLKVDNIIICGHYYCGGVKSAMQSVDMGILNPWLRNIRDIYRMYHVELDGITDEDERYNRLVELNVQEQCINAIKTSAVQKAFKERGLLVHGWVFDIRTGKLFDLKIDFNEILKNIMEIYRII